ncbi:uncharacterized protein V1510DRAFT_414358 [Dipodascopsis tothii]|uniref:uncharacterized protein n=1 Tax=Dipodascopsis tothii TaxID=44089 RepID=UPI0034CEFE53
MTTTVEVVFPAQFLPKEPHGDRHELRDFYPNMAPSPNPTPSVRKVLPTTPPYRVSQHVIGHRKLPAVLGPGAPGASQLTFYDAADYKRSPVYNSYVPLAIADVYALRHSGTARSLFFYLNHPVEYVQITGVCISTDTWYAKVVYVLDDGTGFHIRAVCREDMVDKTLLGDLTSHKDIAKADALTVKGRLVLSKRFGREIEIKAIERLRDTMDEIAAMEAAMKTKTRILDRPWTCSPPPA